MSVLRGLIIPRLNFRLEGPKLEVLTYIHQEPQTGQLLYADEDLLVLSSDSAHIALSEPHRASFIAADNIKHITIQKGFLGRLINDFDLPTGGSKTIYKNKFLPAIKHDMIAFIMPSPDLKQRLLEEKKNLQPAQRKVDRAYIQSIYDRFQFSISYTLLVNNAVATKVGGWLNYSKTVQPKSSSFNFNVGLAYRLNPTFKVGLDFSYLDESTVSTEKIDETLSGFQLDALANYTYPVRITPDIIPEITVGAGFSFARFTSKTNLIAIFPGYTYSEIFQKPYSALGGKMEVGFNYFITNNVSFEIGINSYIYPVFDRENRVVWNLGETHLLRKVENNDDSIILINLITGLNLDF